LPLSSTRCPTPTHRAIINQSSTMFARLIYSALHFSARNGLTDSASSAKSQSRTTGIRGETLAYWYLRRHGYTLVARNYTVPGIKGEIDLIGYDGRALEIGRAHV